MFHKLSCLDIIFKKKKPKKNTQGRVKDDKKIIISHNNLDNIIIILYSPTYPGNCLLAPLGSIKFNCTILSNTEGVLDDDVVLVVDTAVDKVR